MVKALFETPYNVIQYLINMEGGSILLPVKHDVLIPKY